MALYLKVSNSLESLAVGLSEDLKQARNSVFDPHYIVTQTEGMNNWLKLQLASQLGITANCRFLKPNELINQLYFLLGGPFTDMLSAENLSWLLYKLLGEKGFTERYPAVAAYYQHSGPERDIRRMALAEKVADLFDQYQVYRPEMIRQWNASATIPAPGNGLQNEWQQYLWTKAKTDAGGALPDKTMVGTYILQALKQADKHTGLAARMPAIHLFGLSIITAYHVEILHELSTFIDIHFHIINPAPSVYWFDDRSERQLAVWRRKGLEDLAGGAAGNALLTGWGRVIQDSFGLFFQYDDFLNAYEDTGIIIPEPDSLLHKIQHDVFSAATAGRNTLSMKDTGDGSILINSCYTVAREVEVLYNYLVHLIDKRKESLSPRDVVVMVSDIDAYAPYIKAVFNNAPYRWRYTIADESYTDNDNLFNALQSIMLMNEDNFKAEDVIQLLESSYIRNRFSIADAGRIRRVVNAAHIRFGMEGKAQDETRFVSWEYGIKRIMYGIAMSGEKEYGKGEDSFYPLDILEGSDAQDLIRFCHFVEVLMDSVRERQAARSIADWVVYVERVLHNLLFEPEEDTDDHYNLLMQQLSDYNVLNEYMNDIVTYEVFSYSFLQTLTTATRSGLFANGGITFCSLIPMRSIPFKVVALMGLNYDKFPRREQAANFNLMGRKRQRGDRNLRENDKHLFLETILSAREYLYISYLGQNVSDNGSLPPSALVDELIDYIEAGAEAPDEVRTQLVTKQPLQGFSHKYAEGETRLYSYLNTAARATARDVVLPDKVMEAPGFEEIMLEELVRFFKNPFKAYYNKVLGIYYDDEQVLLSDTEIFSLNKLQQWELKNELLRQTDIGALQKRLVKTGMLPLKNMASVAVLQVEERVEPVRALYTACTQEAVGQSIPFELSIGSSELKGVINGVFNGNMVQVSWSQNETKYLIEAYIRYLAGVAAGAISGAFFISGGKREAIYKMSPLSQPEARKRLADLLLLYKQGFEEILSFHPDFDITPKQVEELDFEGFLKLVDKKLNHYQYPFDDPYIVPEYHKGHFSREEALKSYKLVCRQVIAPLAELFPDYYE